MLVVSQGPWTVVSYDQGNTFLIKDGRNLIIASFPVTPAEMGGTMDKEQRKANALAMADVHYTNWLIDRIEKALEGEGTRSLEDLRAEIKAFRAKQQALYRIF